METARYGGIGEGVSHIELCRCVEGYVGQFCEDCAPGYLRDPAYGGPLTRCIPCNCHGHSDVCNVNTGKHCIFVHNKMSNICCRYVKNRNAQEIHKNVQEAFILQEANCAVKLELRNKPSDNFKQNF